MSEHKILNVIDYLIDDLSGDIHLSTIERQEMVDDASKIIDVLSLLIDRMKAFRIKAVTEEPRILKLNMNPIPSILLHDIVMLFNKIVLAKDLQIPKHVTVGGNVVIQVNDSMKMKSIIDIVDHLSA